MCYISVSLVKNIPKQIGLRRFELRSLTRCLSLSQSKNNIIIIFRFWKLKFYIQVDLKAEYSSLFFLNGIQGFTPVHFKAVEKQPTSSRRFFELNAYCALVNEQAMEQLASITECSLELQSQLIEYE